MKKFLVYLIISFLPCSICRAYELLPPAIYNAVRSSFKGNEDDAAKVKKYADECQSGKAMYEYARYLYSVKNDFKGTKEYLLKAMGQGCDLAADMYSSILGQDTTLSGQNTWLNFVANYRKELEKKVEEGDVDAICTLGKIQNSDLFFLKFPEEINDRNGLPNILYAALRGNPDAQIIYANSVDGLSDAEKTQWIKIAADAGKPQAICQLMLIELIDGNYQEVVRLAEQKLKGYIAIPGNPNYYHLYSCSSDVILNIAKFMLNNPGYSLKGFGPIKNSDEYFIFSRDGKTIACATYKEKSGLLKIDQNGNRIDHDDIPFIYDEIVPYMHEIRQDSFPILFSVKPYKFRKRFPDDEIPVLNEKGEETSCSFYGSYARQITLPEDFIILNADENLLP